MNYAAAWFLVMIGGGQYLGPMSQQGCQAAGQILQGEGFVCRQSLATNACSAPGGGPGTFTICPVFEFPQVMVKP
jgi:hypothetical protein